MWIMVDRINKRTNAVWSPDEGEVSLELDSDQDLLSDDDDDYSSSTTSRPLDERLVGVVIGGTVVAILLLLGGLLFCVLRRRRDARRGKKYGEMSRVPSAFYPGAAAPAPCLGVGGGAGAGAPPRGPLAAAALAATGSCASKLQLSNGLVYNSVETSDDPEVGRSLQYERASV